MYLFADYSHQSINVYNVQVKSIISVVKILFKWSEFCDLALSVVDFNRRKTIKVVFLKSLNYKIVIHILFIIL